MAISILGTATAQAESIWDGLYRHDIAEKRLWRPRRQWVARDEAGFGLIIQAVAKRFLDIFGSVLLLVFFSPVLLLIAAVIRLTSPGPALFKQDRLGRGCRKFTMYKFRTMEMDAEKKLTQLYARNEMDAILFKMKRDPRTTPVGRILRRLSLDELPQLYNVLKGEMSLVGPRPPVEREVRMYTRTVRRRLDAVPGMTGFWQVSGRSTLPARRGFALDVLYVRKWSLALDLLILLRTIPAVLFGRGAF